MTSQLVRIDPTSGSMTSFTGPNRVYTYSDFTGSVRRSVIGTGSFVEDFDAGCAAPVWGSLVYDISTPPLTSVQFTIRSDPTAAGLDTATTVPLATAPPDVSPADTGAALAAAGVSDARFFRLTTGLNGSGGASPVVRSYQLTWSCP